MSYDHLLDDELPQSPPSSPYASRHPSWRRQPGSYGPGSVNGTVIAVPSGPSSTVNMNTNASLDLSDPQLSAERRKKLDAINNLRDLGLENDNIELPRIVAIGPQSVGKSSLIQSIADITLPKASGTCTRCPIECRLISTREPWECIVSLKFMTDENGRELFKPRIEPFGAPIKRKDEVEERIRRAQTAILNPSIDPKHFLGNGKSSNRQHNFSKNCICVQIRSPAVTDLSFVDLPGIIGSVANGGRDEDVEEVTNLVSSYIEKAGSIILFVVACESMLTADFENQGAYRLAKRYDPDGVRTIGVLTKPDRIPDGEHARWFDLIRNHNIRLKHGWFCVRQPSSKELEDGVTLQDALREEFFKTLPWSGLDPIYKKRLGTNAVVRTLNNILMTDITKSLPDIAQKLQQLVQKTKEELLNLPKPLSNDHVMELMHLVNGFTDRLFACAEGSGQNIWSEADGTKRRRDNHFPAICAAHESFKKHIRSTAPNFIPYNRTSEQIHLFRAKLLFHEDAPEDSLHKPIHVNEVIKTIELERTRELPGYIPAHIVNDLVADSIGKWKCPALDLIDDIYGIITKHQSFLIDLYFEKYSNGGLHSAVKNLMHEYMQERREQAEQQVGFLLTLEKNNTFTMNKALFQHYKDQILKTYQDAHPDRTNVTSDPGFSMMATVNAYFHVAYKRFIDMVPMAIDNELVRIDKQRLEEELLKGLKVTDAEAQEYCKKLLVEPANVSGQREELVGRRERLMEAQKALLAV